MGVTVLHIREATQTSTGAGTTSRPLTLGLSSAEHRGAEAFHATDQTPRQQEAEKEVRGGERKQDEDVKNRPMVQ